MHEHMNMDYFPFIGANNISTVPYIGKNMVWIERNLSAAYRGSIQELLHTLEAI